MTAGTTNGKTRLTVAIICIVMCSATAVWPNWNSGSIWTIAMGVAFGTPFLAIPFVVLWLFGRRVQSNLISNAFILAMLAALAWWLVVFWDSFLVPENSDPQNGLAFVFAPIYSSFAALLVGAALAFIDRRRRR
jgi:hypothetical protein